MKLPVIFQEPEWPNPAHANRTGTSTDEDARIPFLTKNKDAIAAAEKQLLAWVNASRIAELERILAQLQEVIRNTERLKERIAANGEENG